MFDTKLKCGTCGEHRSAVTGLLACQAKEGASPLQLQALTRNPTGAAAEGLRIQGLDVVRGDLDDAVALTQALQGVDMVYCHALSTDAGQWSFSKSNTGYQG